MRKRACVPVWSKECPVGETVCLSARQAKKGNRVHTYGDVPIVESTFRADMHPHAPLDHCTIEGEKLFIVYLHYRKRSQGTLIYVK